MAAILLGIINIAIVVALLVLIGLIVVWLLGWLRITVPQNVQRAFMAVVVLIALYMMVALIFGMPTIRLLA